MRKVFWKALAFFILGIFGGIFADQILWPYFVERPLFYEYNLEPTPVYVTERNEVIVEENKVLKDAIEKVESSVIGVKTRTKTGTLEGSGLILTSDGLVVTLAELVPQGNTFSFFVDGQLAHFQVLKRDLKENLALIKVEKTNLVTLGFADFERLKLGERIFLVGVVINDEVKKSANEGIVKSFNEDEINTNIFESLNLVGSPLFNIEGEILGLNTIDSFGRVTAIPVTKIKVFAGF